MDKQKFKEHLLSLEEKTIEEAEMNYEDFLTTNLLDKTEVIAADEQSQHRASLEISDKLDHQVHIHKDHLDVINNLDYSPANEVKAGAIVQTNDRYIFVGVAKSKFEFEGKQFIGISTNAPIYGCMKGKKKGDECDFNGTIFKIQEIH